MKRGAESQGIKYGRIINNFYSLIIANVLTIAILFVIITIMIIWDNDKYKMLKDDRNIDLIDIEQIILDKKYITSLKNPSRPNQRIFIINYNNYIHAVPYIIDDNKNIIIKTAYASRKYNKIYGEEKNEI